jgi:hypothetical protein
MVVTKELILAGKTGSGGWKAKQLKIIGVSWPPEKGWMDRAVGRLISNEDADRFVSYKGTKRKPKQGQLGIFTERTSFTLPDCGCKVAPWLDCEHTEAR